MKTEHLLAAYGTLRPGEVNHRLLENVPGEWLDGWVTGDRGEEAHRTRHRATGAQRLGDREVLERVVADAEGLLLGRTIRALGPSRLV